jgi:hypothetical protein
MLASDYVFEQAVNDLPKLRRRAAAKDIAAIAI